MSVHVSALATNLVTTILPSLGTADYATAHSVSFDASFMGSSDGDFMLNSAGPYRQIFRTFPSTLGWMWCEWWLLSFAGWTSGKMIVVTFTSSNAWTEGAFDMSPPHASN